MADLLALQPNMDIKLHIVAPFERKDKVMSFCYVNTAAGYPAAVAACWFCSWA